MLFALRGTKHLILQNRGIIMWYIISKLLSTHSVAFAILISNIVSTLIVTYKNSKERTLQNKYQDTKEMLGTLLEILHDLDFIKYKFFSSTSILVSHDNDELLKKNILKIVLNCKKFRHIINRSNSNFPQTVMVCNEIYNFLSVEISETDISKINQKIAYLIIELNQSIESEWAH